MFYAGVLARNRGFDYLIDTIAGIEGVHLDIAGFGADEERVHEKIKEYPERVSFLGRIPYQEVLERSHQADVLFALYDPAVKNHQYSSPNKLFEAMMLGKPIIVSDKTGSLSTTVTTYGCGIVVPYGDTKELIRAVERLKDAKVRESMGEKGMKAYESEYSWQIMAKRLIHLYSSLQ